MATHDPLFAIPAQPPRQSHKFDQTTRASKTALLRYDSRKSPTWVEKLISAIKKKADFEVAADPGRKRLSIKVSQSMANEIAALMDGTKLNKTDLMKSIVLQIHEDIIKPTVPKHIDELQTLAAVSRC